MKAVNEQKWNINSETLDEFLERNENEMFSIVPKKNLESQTLKILEFYESADQESRKMISDAFRNAGHGILSFPDTITPEQRLRYGLLTQCIFPDEDTRDIIMGVNAMFKDARDKGVNTKAVASGILNIASDRDYYGMGRSKI